MGTARPGLAQGPCWQQKTVANAPVVKDAHLQVAVQRVVLQAVVTHNDLGLWVLCQQRRRRVKTLDCYKNRCVADLLDKSRFITNLIGQAGGQHFAAVLCAPSVPT